MCVVEIFGPGCRQCERATAEIRAVVDLVQIDAEVRHATDPFEIVARGALFMVPVVLVDGAAMSRGGSRPATRSSDGSASAPGRGHRRVDT